MKQRKLSKEKVKVQKESKRKNKKQREKIENAKRRETIKEMEKEENGKKPYLVLVSYQGPYYSIIYNCFP
jgi:hypothetical protein